MILSNKCRLLGANDACSQRIIILIEPCLNFQLLSEGHSKFNADIFVFYKSLNTDKYFIRNIAILPIISGPDFEMPAQLFSTLD